MSQNQLNLRTREQLIAEYTEAVEKSKELFQIFMTAKPGTDFRDCGEQLSEQNAIALRLKERLEDIAMIEQIIFENLR